MAAEKQEEPRSYQRALRVVGRYLDSEPSFNLTISETANGFTVDAHSKSSRADERRKHFDWDRLDDMDRLYSAGRGLGSKTRKTPSVLFPCGHQQALRKLGSILDAEDATEITVESVENGLGVSYLRSTAQAGGAPEKVEHTYGPEDLCQ